MFMNICKNYHLTRFTQELHDDNQKSIDGANDAWFWNVLQEYELH